MVDPPGGAKLYRPLQPTPPYPGVKVERDIKYFDNDRTVLDVFSSEKGGGKRPVLIYVSGGAGNKIEPVPDGDAFYDNIMLWAVKNGMTGVNVQRRGGQGLEWDETAKDIGRVIEWVQQNISKYKGNPDRVFIWAHSAGTGPVSTYVGHPELYGPKGVGLKGVVLMGTPSFNIAPVTVPGRGGRGPGGPPPGGKGGPPDGKGGKGKGFGRAPLDPATQLARSNLPGLLKSNIPFFLGAGEIDLARSGRVSRDPQGPALHGEELSDRDDVQGSQPRVGSFLAQHGGRFRHGSHPEVDEERKEVIVERASQAWRTR